jgi:hypothetical protein
MDVPDRVADRGEVVLLGPNHVCGGFLSRHVLAVRRHRPHAKFDLAY